MCSSQFAINKISYPLELYTIMSDKNIWYTEVIMNSEHTYIEEVKKLNPACTRNRHSKPNHRDQNTESEPAC